MQKYCGYIISSFLISFLLLACRHVEVNQKTSSFPGQQWSSTYHPAVLLKVTDTGQYNLYLVVRHTLQYPYNNLLGGIRITDTAGRHPIAVYYNAPLVDRYNNWKGTRIDNLYDHFIRLDTTIHLVPDTYKFTFNHFMNISPLPEINNIGIVIHKIE